MLVYTSEFRRWYCFDRSEYYFTVIPVGMDLAINLMKHQTKISIESTLVNSTERNTNIYSCRWLIPESGLPTGMAWHSNQSAFRDSSSLPFTIENKKITRCDMIDESRSPTQMNLLVLLMIATCWWIYVILFIYFSFELISVQVR